ncbi:MAG: hypothetical protein U0525_06090 [Patescibacteria group bacterium]
MSVENPASADFWADCDYINNRGERCGDVAPYESGLGYRFCAARGDQPNNNLFDCATCPLHLWKRADPNNPDKIVRNI